MSIESIFQEHCPVCDSILYYSTSTNKIICGSNGVNTNSSHFFIVLNLLETDELYRYLIIDQYDIVINKYKNLSVFFTDETFGNKRIYSSSNIELHTFNALTSVEAIQNFILI